MKTLVSIAIFTSLALASLPGRVESQSDNRLDASKHVRIHYNQFNTSDSTVFSMLLQRIRTFDDSHPQMSLEGYVFSQMNVTWDQEVGAWVTPQIETLRHSREDIANFVGLLQDVAKESYETTVNAQRELFCPSTKFASMGQKFAALEKRDIDDRVEADFFLDKTLTQIDEQVAADLQAWIGRSKQGYKGWKFNYRTLWAGRENQLDVRLSDTCQALGDKQ